MFIILIKDGMIGRVFRRVASTRQITMAIDTASKGPAAAGRLACIENHQCGQASRVGGSESRLKRYFSDNLPIIQLNSISNAINYSMAPAYDSEKSGEYLSFLRLDIHKSELLVNKLRTILTNLDERDRDGIIKQFNVLFNLRVAYNKIAQTIWMETLETLEAKISAPQRKLMMDEFNSFVDMMLATVSSLNTKQRLDMLVLITLSKISSHRILVGLIPNLISDIDNMTFSDINRMLSCCKMLFTRYMKITGYKLRNEEHFISLDEMLLKDVFTIMDLKYMVRRITEMIPNEPLDQVLASQIKMLRIMEKYSKMGGLNVPMKKLYLDKLTVKLYESLSSISKLPDYMLMDYFTMCGLIMSQGRNSPLVVKMLKEAQIQILKSKKQDEWKVISFGILSKNTYGNYDKAFFESIELPIIVDKLRKSDDFNSGALASCMLMVYKMKHKDREVHKLILEHVIRIEKSYREKRYDVAHDFHMKSIHQILSYGINLNIIPLDMIPMIADVANRLSVQCLCARHKRNFEYQELGPLPDGVPEIVISTQDGTSVKLLDCIDNQASSNFVKEHFPEPRLEKAQVYSDNFNEILIKEILQNYVPVYLEMPVEVLADTESIQACSYKWDAVLKFRDIPKKIGFEVTGEAYSSEFTGLKLNKMIKMEVLTAKEFTAIVIDVGTTKLKSFILENNPTMLVISLIEQIRKQIKQKTGFELTIKPEKQEEYSRLVAMGNNKKYRTIIAKTENMAANNKITPIPRKASPKASAAPLA